MRALSKNPDERQQTVKDFYDEITLGAGPRLSVLASQAAHASTSQMPAGGLPPARSGQTQIGEPLFASAPPGGGSRTMVDQGPPPGALGGPAPATTAAQVLPPPQASPPRKNNAPIIAGVAVLGVLGLVGLVFALKGGSGSSGTDETITMPTTTASAVVVAADPIPTGSATPVSSGEPDAKPSTDKKPTGGGTSGSGTTPTGTGTGQPNANAEADEACRSATNLAAVGHTERAVTHYSKCSGSGQAGARAAIDGSARRAVASQGCAAKSDALAAARIGASSALNELKKRKPKCPGL